MIDCTLLYTKTTKKKNEIFRRGHDDGFFCFCCIVPCWVIIGMWNYNNNTRFHYYEHIILEAVFEESS